MTDSIGTARLDIVVDTSQFDNAIAAAKSRVSGMSSAAQAEYEKLNAAEKRRINSLLSQADLIGKTRQEQILYNAALKGAPTAVLDDLKRRLAGVKAETDAGAISAKQYNAALRGVPAQLTDIFTGLASGQNPMTVLIQQGGQLKDMFGGVGNAAKALTSSIVGLINPYTVAAAAASALLVAIYQGSQESNAFAKALAVAGATAGVTANDLRNMQVAISSGAVSQADAARALVEVAKSGKFAGEQFAIVAQAAAAMEAATGQSIEQTVSQFAELGRDPTNAAAKLNESVHFLTATIYDQIKALEEQGRTQDAATLSMKAYADEMQRRAQDVSDNIGFLQKRFRELQVGASAAWDAVVGLGRDLSIDEKLAQQAAKIAEIKKRGISGGDGLLLSRAGPRELAEAQAEFTRLQRLATEKNKETAQAAAAQNANDTYIALKEAGEKLDSRLVQLQRQRAETVAKAAKAATDALFSGPNGLALNAQIRDAERANLANIDREIAEEKKKGQKKPPSTRAVDNADLRADLQTVRDQLAQEQAAIQNNRRVTEAEYSAKLITVDEYYRRAREAIEGDTKAQEAALQAQIHILRERGAKGADAINNARQAAQLEAQLNKVRADGVTQLQVLTTQEKRAAEERENAFRAYVNGLDATSDALKRNYDAAIARIGVSDKEYAKQQALNDVYLQAADALKALNEQRDRGDFRDKPGEYERRLDALRRATQEEVRIVEEGERLKTEAQARWQNGARKALQEYVDAAADFAGQTASLFGSALSGAEDVLVEFFTKGKADIGAFLDSIGADITRFVVRQQLAKLAKRFLPGLTGDGEGDSAAALSAAAGELAASAAPLLGAAAALSTSAAALAAAGLASGGTGGSNPGSTNNFGNLIGSFMSSFGGGYSSGGFTGKGGVNEVAGFVHRGEVVWSQADIARAGGVGAVERMRAGDGQRASVNLSQAFVIQGWMDRRTGQQLARTQAREAQRAVQRNS